ncbi:MAG: type II secretion system F family protein, partial [Candidatus Kerfeldbacteria bacterium]|nr:type II secretion system F family protein [Candidatus Kerfeldbacteria bacterium]
MAFFSYKAKDITGRTYSGVVEAPTSEVAENLLHERKLILIELHEKKRSFLIQSSAGFLNRIPRRDIVVFARQLATMIASNIPIVRALRILVKQTDNTTFRVIVSEIADEVDGGAKLSQTLGRYPQVFDTFFVQMIRAGETSGKLDQTLEYLADQKENDYELVSKVRGALVYPAFIVLAMVGVLIVMMTFVIPRLVSVLIDSGAELPAATRALIAISNAFVDYWWLMLFVLLVLIISLVFWRRTENGKYATDAFKLRIPVVGSIYQKVYLSRFSRSLATLVSSGVPIIPSLEITGDLVGNVVYKKLTEVAIMDVKEGRPINRAFLESNQTPIMVSQMLAVGEESGKLDQVMRKLSDFYAREVGIAVQALASLIEPLVIVGLGVGAG